MQMNMSMPEAGRSRRRSSPRARSASHVRRQPSAANGEINVSLEVTISLRLEYLTNGDLPSSHHVRRQPLHTTQEVWSSTADDDAASSALAEGLAEGAPPGRLAGDEDFISMMPTANGATGTGARSGCTNRNEPRFERWSISGQRHNPAFEEQMHSICPDSLNVVSSGRVSPHPDVPNQILRWEPGMMPDRRVNTPPTPEMRANRAASRQRRSSCVRPTADSSAWAGRARSSGAEGGARASHQTNTRREAEHQATPAELRGEPARHSSEDGPRRSTRRGWRGALERAWHRLDSVRSAIFPSETIVTVDSLQQRIDNELFKEIEAEWMSRRQQR